MNVLFVILLFVVNFLFPAYTHAFSISQFTYSSVASLSTVPESIKEVGGIFKTLYVDPAIKTVKSISLMPGLVQNSIAQTYNPVNDTILSIWCTIKVADIACDPEAYVVQVSIPSSELSETNTASTTSQTKITASPVTYTNTKIVERVIERYAPASVAGAYKSLTSEEVISLIQQYAPVSVVTERLGSIQGRSSYDGDIAGLRGDISGLQSDLDNLVTSPWTVATSGIYYSSGRVGIGTSTPEGALGVVGDIHFTGNLYQNGVVFSGGGSGLTSLNAQADSVQFFATSSTGSDFNIVSSGGTHTFSLPTASSTVRGALSASDWTTFNNKVSTTRTINTSGPLAGGGDLSSDRALSINLASSSADGYLSSTDWTTFNNKVSSQWTTLSSNIYFNTGSVGIGTTTPAYNLDVYGSLRISTSSTPALAVDPSFGTGLNRVGINTSSGIHALTVVTSASSDGITVRRNNTATNEEARYNFRVSTSEGSATAYISGMRVNTPSAGDMALVFYNQKTGSLSESMRIDSTGNVGIGTSSPLATLAITTNTGSSDALRIASSTNKRLFTVGQSGDVLIPNGKLSISGDTSDKALGVAGDINFTGSLYFSGNRAASFRAGNQPHIVMGVGAGYGALDNGDQINTIIGGRAGAALNSSVEATTFIGGEAGYNTSAGVNTFIGYRSGYTNTTGSGNTILGASADVGSVSLSNATAIGAGAIVSASDSLVLGSSGIKVGIGTSSPLATLAITTNTGSSDALRIASSTNARLFTVGQSGDVSVPNGKLSISGDTSGKALGVTGDINFSGGIYFLTNKIISVSANRSNMIIGYGAGHDAVGADDGGHTIVGFGAGAALSTVGEESGNTLIGSYAGGATKCNSCSGAGGNTFVGANAGATNVGGSSNTTLGYGADVGSSALTNATAIGYGAVVSSSSALVLGSSGIKVGIGTSSPNATLAITTNTGSSDALRIASSTNKRLFTVGQSGDVLIPNGKLGIGTVAPQQMLHVYRSTDGAPVRFEDTNGYCEIDPTSTSWTCTSDERLKKDIVELSKNTSLENLNKLQAVTFKWKTQSDNTKRFGFIAQQVEPIFPEFVTTDEKGFKSVAYGSFTPIIISAIQELDKKVQNLEQLIASSTPIASVSSVSFVGDLVQSIVGRFTKIQVEDGIEIRDRATNKIYCATIISGEWVKMEGECSSTPISSMINIATPPPVTDSPVSEISSSTSATSTIEISTEISTSTVSTSSQTVSTPDISVISTSTPETIPDAVIDVSTSTETTL